MYSREQLVLGALQELGVVGSGQTPEAEDAKAVDDRINSVMADLAKRNVWVWGDPDQIDDAAYNHLVMIMANTTGISRQFGVAADDAARVYAEDRLKELRMVQDAGDPIRAEYF